METEVRKPGWKRRAGLLWESLASPSAADIIVCALILAAGILSFFLYQRSPDFPYEDVSYVELANSLVHNGTYAFNFTAEKVQPPGLPVILGLICASVGCSHDVLVRAMSVFFTLGLLLSYALIRWAHGRWAAGASCLLLASSPILFSAATSRLWPSFPYLCTSMLTLLVAPKLDEATSRGGKVLWGSLFCVLVIVSVFIQSAGVALIGGLICWMVASFLGDKKVAWSRFKILLPIVLLAVVAEAMWMQRGSNPEQWPLQGYPGSYLSQLILKNGNYPELGLATASDIVARVDGNVRARTGLFVELITRHWVNPSYSSAAMTLPLLLILIGVGSSILQRKGDFCAWYFLGYEWIYLLWPWTLEVRFFLPTAPLACLYFFEGKKVFTEWCYRYPRRVGAVCLPLFGFICIHSAVRGWQAGWSMGKQWKISALFWLIGAVISASMIKGKPLPTLEGIHEHLGFFRKRFSAWGISFNLDQALGTALVVIFIGMGIPGELDTARKNLSFGAAELSEIPDIQAARWIESHVNEDAVVAARRVPLVYHYAHRKVIWFPPMTNAELLMAGLRKHHIRYVIVIERDFNYYRPPDEYCFKIVSDAYPEAFRLVEQEKQVRIYEVVPDRPS